VHSRQRKLRCAVVECRGFPDTRRMTALAIVAVMRCHMVWIRRLCKVRRVTLVAIRISQLVIAVRVT
jgi:hypothetical protein